MRSDLLIVRLLTAAVVFALPLVASWWLAKRYARRDELRMVSLLLIQYAVWISMIVIAIVLAATRTFRISGFVGSGSYYSYQLLVPLGSAVGIIAEDVWMRTRRSATHNPASM